MTLINGVEATPIRLDTERQYLRFYPENDDTYTRYIRLLRKYDRFMPYTHHRCWACGKTIEAGTWYEAFVYVARPAVFVHFLKKKATFWVEKRHYPECPDRLREFEEEMLAEQDRRDREATREHKKRA